MEIKAISILNNQGVDLLRQGNLKAAANTLKMALDLASTRLVLYPTNVIDRRGVKGSIERFAALLAITDRRPFSMQVGLPGSISQDIESPYALPSSRTHFRLEDLYLQTQGFYLSLESFPQAAAGGIFLVEAIVNAFLLYNLGLVSQLQSICGTPGSGIVEADAAVVAIPAAADLFRFRRQQAARSRFLYRKSRMILELAGLATQKATGIPLLDLLFMALHNNSAYAAFTDGDYDRCRSFFYDLEWYRNSLLIMPAYNLWDRETITIMSRYMSDFLLNAMILKKPDVASAA